MVLPTRGHFNCRTMEIRENKQLLDAISGQDNFESTITKVLDISFADYLKYHLELDS